MCHQPLKHFRVMCRTQRNESHPFPDAADDALNHFVGDLVMRGVPPLEEHVGLGENVFCWAVFRFLEAVVHAVRVNSPNDFALALVDVLSPDGDAERFGHPGRKTNRELESWKI